MVVKKVQDSAKEGAKPPTVSPAMVLSMKKMFQNHLDKPRKSSFLAEDEHLMGLSTRSQFEEAAARQRLQFKDMQPAENTVDRQLPKENKDDSIACFEELTQKTSSAQPGPSQFYLERTEVFDTARPGGDEEGPGSPDAKPFTDSERGPLSRKAWQSWRVLYMKIRQD